MGAYFLDTSSLVKRYHQESGTEIVDQLFEESEHRLIISDISIIEFYSAIGLKVRTGEVKSTAFSTLRKLFSNDVAQGVYQIVRFGEKEKEEAVRLLIRYAPRYSLRTLDAIQLAGERILSETDVQRLIGMESKKRNKVLLNLIYIAGLRVSEACSLKWRDIQPAISGGYITVFGKGDKTRTILIGKRMYEELLSLKGKGGQDDPVFVSQKYGPLSLTQAWRIVKTAAKRAGINPGASPHWLRHAHASHALERGCPIHLVQATLGHASVATTGRYLHARPNDSSALYLAQ